MFHAEQFDFEFMKDTLLLMCGEMVRALGRKTQTRRIINPQLPNVPEGYYFDAYNGGPNWNFWTADNKMANGVAGPNKYSCQWTCPYGKPGDRLTVKEAVWMWCERKPNGKTKTGRDKWLYVPMREAQVFYCADHPEKPALDVVSPDTGNQWGWRKKIGRVLPRWASRITLEIVSVRVERVQSITEADALAEGVTVKPSAGIASNVCGGTPGPAQFEYYALWDSINAKRGFGWDKNPWVWVVEFKRVEAGK